MIIQLPSGKIIECSVEIYLDLSDQEINELNGLGVQYTSEESSNPFYKSFAETSAKKAFQEDFLDEYEPELHEIHEIEKRIDSDFHPDDI